MAEKVVVVRTPRNLHHEGNLTSSLICCFKEAHRQTHRQLIYPLPQLSEYSLIITRLIVQANDDSSPAQNNRHDLYNLSLHCTFLLLFYLNEFYYH